MEGRSDVLRTLDQVIMQPLTNLSESLLPVKVALQGRVVVRCDECERTLVKRDFGVATYKFKISVSKLRFLLLVKYTIYSHSLENSFPISGCPVRSVNLKLDKRPTSSSLSQTCRCLH